MARHLIDFDPLTKAAVYMDWREDGRETQLVHTQDVEPIIEHAKALSSDTDRTAKQIKQDMWHYARVPNVVIMKMKLEDGVDFWDLNDRPKVFHLLNTKYAYCKTTQKTHNVRHA